MQNDRHAVTSPVHQALPSQTGCRGTARQKRHDQFVSIGLSQVQGVGCKGIDQGSGNVEFEAIAEHMQPYARTRYRIVSVCHCIDQRLEHCALAELRTLCSCCLLCCAHQHIFAYEVQRLGDLLVERSADVAGVRLVVHVGAFAGVADRLYIGVRQPALRLARA